MRVWLLDGMLCGVVRVAAVGRVVVMVSVVLALRRFWWANPKVLGRTGRLPGGAEAAGWGGGVYPTLAAVTFLTKHCRKKRKMSRTGVMMTAVFVRRSLQLVRPRLAEIRVRVMGNAQACLAAVMISG